MSGRGPERGPRRALVLGGGGVLGFAWTLGALAALESAAGFDARDADVVVGTSAGAVTAALLGCRLGVGALCRHHQGVPLPQDPVIGYDYDGSGGALPPRPRLRPAAPRLVLDGVLHPHRVTPLVALSGLLPVGRGSLAPVHELLATVTAETGFAERWPDAPRPWVVAVDYSTGRRVVFGRDDLAMRRVGAPRIVGRAALADAVTASCSIPGWYAPTVIDAVPYVDGGVASNASADLLLDAAVEEVYILAPMGGRGRATPRTTVQRLERAVRRTVSRTIAADAARLRARGIGVKVIEPGAAELQAMGTNLMDPASRVQVLATAERAVADRLARQRPIASLRSDADSRATGRGTADGVGGAG